MNEEKQGNSKHCAILRLIADSVIFSDSTYHKKLRSKKQKILKTYYKEGKLIDFSQFASKDILYDKYVFDMKKIDKKKNTIFE